MSSALPMTEDSDFAGSVNVDDRIPITGHGSAKFDLKSVAKDPNQCSRKVTSFDGKQTTICKKLHVNLSATLAEVFPGKDIQIVENFDCSTDWGTPFNTDEQVVTQRSLCMKKAKQMIDQLDIAVTGSSESRHEFELDVDKVYIAENKGSRDITSLEGYPPLYRVHGAGAIKRMEQVLNTSCYYVEYFDSKIWGLTSCSGFVARPDEKLFCDELNSISEECRKMCRKHGQRMLKP